MKCSNFFLFLLNLHLNGKTEGIKYLQSLIDLLYSLLYKILIDSIIFLSILIIFIHSLVFIIKLLQFSKLFLEAFVGIL